MYKQCCHRLLFWSDWGAVAKIEKSDTIGNNRRTLVDSDLLTPMGLVLDMKESRLYWVDRDRQVPFKISELN